MEIEDKGNDGIDDEESEAGGASKRKLICIIQTKVEYFKVKIERCQLSLICINIMNQLSVNQPLLTNL